MKTQHTPHIDVTEEENLLFQDLLLKQPQQPTSKLTTISFKTTLFVVLGLHIIGAAAVFGLQQTTDVKTIIKELLPTESVVASPNSSPSPTPESPAITPEASAPVATKPQPVVPATKQQLTVPVVPKHNIPTPIKEYVVKKGDNFNKIVKKYKLNPQALIKLNHIKNTNSLIVGQKLKFM